jgi:NAD(P)-dependent dehydrogenase (short-subunit alcohol dehydrogenase family)
MTITFITGANKGLGLETARRLVEHGHTVLVGARDEKAGRAAADTVGARFVQIDISDDESVARAAADVQKHEGALDVLINNAGIAGTMGQLDDLTGDAVLRILNVNVVGAVRTTRAFLPLLDASSDPVIVNVSSGMGLLDLTNDPKRKESGLIAPAYTSSKAALNMLTTQHAKAFPHIRVNAADPGYTKTDINGNTGTQTVTEGTDAIVQLATEGPGHGSGRLVSRDGEISWG